jgi:hypothetical protein
METGAAQWKARAQQDLIAHYIPGAESRREVGAVGGI